MTKEDELKKQAETEYRKQEERCKHSWNGAVFQFGYLAGAEPREKRIEKLENELKQAKKVQVVEHFEAYGQCRDSKRIKELEQKLEQTEKDLADYQFNYPSIKELSKENAKLKTELTKKADTNHSLVEQMADLESENAELKAKNKWYSEQVCYKECAEVWGNLTKATELLNEFMRISKASDEDFEHDYSELIGETEQFIEGLKENVLQKSQNEQIPYKVI